jgi:hypothetical protein
VNAAVLRQGDHPEVWGFGLRSETAISETRRKHKQ